MYRHIREGYLLGAHTSLWGALPIFGLVGELILHKCSRCRRSLRIIMVERQLLQRDIYSSRKEDGCLLPNRQHLWLLERSTKFTPYMWKLVPLVVDVRFGGSMPLSERKLVEKRSQNLAVTFGCMRVWMGKSHLLLPRTSLRSVYSFTDVGPFVYCIWSHMKSLGYHIMILWNLYFTYLYTLLSDVRRFLLT